MGMIGSVDGKLRAKKRSIWSAHEGNQVDFKILSGTISATVVVFGG